MNNANRGRKTDEAGTAIIEFIFATVALLIPAVYLALTLGHIQAGSYAAQSTAIDAARIASRYPDSARPKVDQLKDMHLDTFGLNHARSHYEFDCSGDCAEPGTTVAVHVTVEVPIPGAGVLFGKSGRGAVTVHASHTDVVAPYYRERS